MHDNSIKRFPAHTVLPRSASSGTRPRVLMLVPTLLLGSNTLEKQRGFK